MGPIGCTETLVTYYPSTLPNIPEDRRPQVLVWLLAPLLRSHEYEHLLKPVTTSCKIKLRITFGVKRSHISPPSSLEVFCTERERDSFNPMQGFFHIPLAVPFNTFIKCQRTMKAQTSSLSFFVTASCSLRHFTQTYCKTAITIITNCNIITYIEGPGFLFDVITSLRSLRWGV